MTKIILGRLEKPRPVEKVAVPPVEKPVPELPPGEKIAGPNPELPSNAKPVIEKTTPARMEGERVPVKIPTPIVETVDIATYRLRLKRDEMEDSRKRFLRMDDNSPG